MAAWEHWGKERVLHGTKFRLFPSYSPGLPSRSYQTDKGERPRYGWVEAWWAGGFGQLVFRGD